MTTAHAHGKAIALLAGPDAPTLGIEVARDEVPLSLTQELHIP